MADLSSFTDTIVARATPSGSGGVAIVRLSGSGAVEVASRLFRPRRGGSVADLPARYLASGEVVEGERVLDEALLVRFAAPRSFTGEDVVELHLHGNPVIAERVVAAAVAAGARRALAGEFTRRAFANGRLDLTQVEGLADLLQAESDEAIEAAERHLRGELRAEVSLFREKIIALLARLELELDFLEEGYGFVEEEELLSLLAGLEEFVERLLGGWRRSDLLRRGPRVLLVGRPNAGKSSLFNAMVGYGRALVSDREGTTRDFVEEKVVVGGRVLHLVDTAGLRESGDEIERMGVELGLELVGDADAVLYLVDARRDLAEEAESLELVRSTAKGPLLIIRSKGDLAVEDPRAGAEHLLCSVLDAPSVLRVLEEVAEKVLPAQSERRQMVTARQRDLLLEMREMLQEARSGDIVETELLSADLRRLLGPLSELAGETVNEEILNTIFGSFCIGK